MKYTQEKGLVRIQLDKLKESYGEVIIREVFKEFYINHFVY